MQNEEIDATNEDAPQVAKTYLWDPSEPVATRVLHMNVWNNGTEVESLYYTHDLQKNVTALFGQAAGRRAQYEHDPYGNPINTTGDAAGINPYRHYNPTDGRWINRDPIAEQGGINLYGFVGNRAGWFGDVLGLFEILPTIKPVIKGECEVVYFIGHNTEVEEFIQKWNNYNADKEWGKYSGNGCHIDGSNGEKGIPGFIGKAEIGIGFADYCVGVQGNCGFNPTAFDPNIKASYPRTQKGQDRLLAAIGYMKMVEHNWKAALDAADQKADNCEDCKCKEIRATVVFTSDYVRSTAGKFCITSYRKARDMAKASKHFQEKYFTGFKNLKKGQNPKNTLYNQTTTIIFECKDKKQTKKK